MKQFTVDYYIQKFSQIPEENWTKGDMGRGNIHCAIGHCNVKDGDISEKGDILIEEGQELAKLIYLVSPQDDLFTTVFYINDSRYKTNYKQETPKQRILAALHDVKELLETNSAVEETNKILKEELQLV